MRLVCEHKRSLVERQAPGRLSRRFASRTSPASAGHLIQVIHCSLGQALPRPINLREVSALKNIKDRMEEDGNP